MPGRVGHVRATVEGGAALVVHKHEGEMVGISRHRQRGHEGAKQLRLARTCGPAHKEVGSVGHEVQLEGPVARGADGRLEVGCAARRGPALLDGLRRRLAHEVDQ